MAQRRPSDFSIFIITPYSILDDIGIFGKNFLEVRNDTLVRFCTNLSPLICNKCSVGLSPWLLILFEVPFYSGNKVCFLWSEIKKDGRVEVPWSDFPSHVYEPSLCLWCVRARMTPGDSFLKISKAEEGLPWRLLVAKNPPTVRETRVWSLGREDPLEKEMQPTPIFLPGESHGQRSLAGYSPWGCPESDMT